MNDNFIPDEYRKEILVLGCGNTLFGDDGFGPAVVENLINNYKIPDNVEIMDAGTGVREVLFTIVLGDKKPKKIIIVDAVNANKSPGEVFEIAIDEMPKNKLDDFSMHTLPTSNLLKELKDFCNVEVIIIAAQIERIPEIVEPGLSRPLVNSIPKAADLVFSHISHV